MYNQIDSNKRKSAFILTMFVVFAAVIAYIGGYYVGGQSFAPYAIIAGLAYVLISYYSGSKMALSLNGAQEVDKNKEPRLYRIVENLAITEGLPMPKVY